MPAIELVGFADASNGVNGVGTNLLRKHKVLPHPREERLHELYPATSVSKPRKLEVDTGIPSLPASDTSSPRTLKHASRRIGLPPTPPTHSRQSSGNHPIVPAPAFDLTPGLSSPDIHVAPTTPLNQQSPPTPDVTPPRAVPLAFKPPKYERYPSSRADSFKTARETPSSDDEDEASTVRLSLPTTKPPEGDVPNLPERLQKRKEVGLGLGLESDNEGTITPKVITKASEQEFVVSGGDWGANSGEGSEVDTEWDDNLMRNVTVRKRRPQRPQIFTDGQLDEVVEDDIISPTNATRDATRVLRSIPLQERIARHRLARDAASRPSTERFAEQIAWPKAVEDPESPSTPDVRRFSAMSGRSHGSTVIEAMVVDALPTRRKTLRHMKKRSGLRDFSSDQSTMSSAPTSVMSIEPRHKLHHATAKIPEHRHRSLASNGTVSTTSSSGRSRREVLKNGGIPVVVVPERRSSTKSSRAPSLRSTSSRRTKRSMSLNSAPLSQSSKFNDPGYSDVLPPRRTMSESAGSGLSVRTIDFPPKIPTRSSSLSAPTSRTTSRAGSLTAESLHAHNLVHAKKVELSQRGTAEAQPCIESQKDSTQNTRLSVDQNGDPFFGNRLSTQVTPFSQASYETAGTTAEVSEAMAVSIYPHQNKSVLVVQQRAPSDPSSSRRTSSDPSSPAPQTTESLQHSLKPLNTSQPTTTINDKPTTGPVTPPQPIHPMDAVDSPLRNPRAPPAPPAIKFIPPTPAALTPGTEEDRQLGYALADRPATSDDDKPKRGLSLMRRAFSNRRNSMSTAQAGAGGFLKRTFSLSNHGSGRKDVSDETTQTSKGKANPSTLYPSVADKPADGTKLHPFWRPAHFWDDLEDRESGSDDEVEYTEDNSERGGGGGYPMIDNRPGMPKRGLSGTLKRTFAILPIRDDEGYSGSGKKEFRPRFEDHRKMQRTPSGNMRVVKTRSSASLRREAERRRMLDARGERGSPDWEGGSGGHNAREIKVPGLGVTVEYVGWSGLRRIFSQRGEKRRVQRADALRRSISAPRGVRSGVDDVLRGRS